MRKKIFFFCLIFLFLENKKIIAQKIQNDTLTHLKNIKQLIYSLDEKAFVLSGKKEEFEQKHTYSDNQNFNKILDNEHFLPELSFYKPNDVLYNVFCMGKWERKHLNKRHFLVLYGSHTNIEYGITNYYLASFDEKGRFINKVDIFGYSLVDGKLRVRFDKKNNIYIGVELYNINANAPTKEDLYNRINISPNGLLKKSKVQRKELSLQDFEFLFWALY